MCLHTTICVSSYYYMCVLILLYMCPQTATYLAPDTTVYVVKVRVKSGIGLLYVCLPYVCLHTTSVCIPLSVFPHTAICVCPYTTIYAVQVRVKSGIGQQGLGQPAADNNMDARFEADRSQLRSRGSSREAIMPAVPEELP